MKFPAQAGMGAVLFLCITVAAPATASSEFLVHSFFAGDAGGDQPQSGLVADADGTLYTTTSIGGDLSCGLGYGCGTVVRLTPPLGKHGQWTTTVLHTFEGGSDGAAPFAALVFDAAGNLYGTTNGGGDGNGTGDGTVFRLSRPVGRGGAWGYDVLFRFNGFDGAVPEGRLLLSGGAVFGTTAWGGLNDCGSDIGCGTVFELSPSGASAPWTETVLHEFDEKDGEWPQAGLTLGKNGNLYGATRWGGTYTSFCESGCGVVFEVAPPVKRGGAWKERTIHFFQGNDGASPLGDLVADAAGNLLGTTCIGQAPGKVIDGTVFELSPMDRGARWAETMLHVFDGTDGNYPAGGVLLAGPGRLYGTAQTGGPFRTGTAYSLERTARGEWKLTVLHAFAGQAGTTDGAYPAGELIFGKDGALYGTTFKGGVGHSGTVFALPAPMMFDDPLVKNPSGRSLSARTTQ